MAMGVRWSAAVTMQVVQEIKVLRSSVSQREKEQAERATLVQQEKLLKSRVGSQLRISHASRLALPRGLHAGDKL
jgi:nucleosome binding factor SPN SPT16 subunit